MAGDATHNQGDILSMSDEDILKMAPPIVIPPPVEEAPPADAPADNTNAEPETKTDDNGEGAGTEGAKEPGNVEEVVVEGDDETDNVPPKGKEQVDGQESKPASAKQVPSTEKKPETQANEPAPIDYEAAYKKLTAPFKANGKEIAVESVEDAIALMQMGANYNKKMAGLKPNLQLLKMLENNGLLDTDKIGYLIDLSKKDPAAIAKLVKEAGIEPLDLDETKASEYKPGNHAVNPTEMAVNEVLDSIQETPTYGRTLQVVGTQWDAASKETIAKFPNVIATINDHMQNGIYDRINAVVERERTFGRLKDMSDLEAYKAVGDALQAQGAFSDIGKAPANQAPEVKPAPVAAKPAVSQEEQERLRDKKRAASSTKPSATATKPAKDFNPLALSDEDFKKMTLNKFL